MLYYSRDDTDMYCISSPMTVTNRASWGLVVVIQSYLTLLVTTEYGYYLLIIILLLAVRLRSYGHRAMKSAAGHRAVACDIVTVRVRASYFLGYKSDSATADVRPSAPVRPESGSKQISAHCQLVSRPPAAHHACSVVAGGASDPPAAPAPRGDWRGRPRLRHAASLFGSAAADSAASVGTTERPCFGPSCCAFLRSIVRLVCSMDHRPRYSAITIDRNVQFVCTAGRKSEPVSILGSHCGRAARRRGRARVGAGRAG